MVFILSIGNHDWAAIFEIVAFILKLKKSTNILCWDAETHAGAVCQH